MIFHVFKYLPIFSYVSCLLVIVVAWKCWNVVWFC